MAWWSRQLHRPDPLAAQPSDWAISYISALLFLAGPRAGEGLRSPEVTVTAIYFSASIVHLH